MCDYYEKSYFCQTMYYQVYLKINKLTVKNNVFFFLINFFPLLCFGHMTTKIIVISIAFI